MEDNGNSNCVDFWRKVGRGFPEYAEVQTAVKTKKFTTHCGPASWRFPCIYTSGFDVNYKKGVLVS
jgi:hypothetical protein